MQYELILPGIVNSQRHRTIGFVWSWDDRVIAASEDFEQLVGLPVREFITEMNRVQVDWIVTEKTSQTRPDEVRCGLTI